MKKQIFYWMSASLLWLACYSGMPSQAHARWMADGDKTNCPSMPRLLPDFDTVEMDADGYQAGDFAVVSLDGKMGIIRLGDGRTILPLEFDLAIGDAPPFVASKGRVWWIVDGDGAKRQLKLTGVQSVDAFSEGLAAFENRDGLYGYIDAEGAQVIPARYQQAGRMVNGRAAANLDGSWGAIDKTGKEVLPFVYAFVHLDADSRLVFVLENDGRKNILDQNGKSLVDGLPDDLSLISFNRETGVMGLKSRAENRMYLVDANGKMTSKGFDLILAYHEGMAPVMAGQKWGYADASGRLAIAPEYVFSSKFKAGLASVGGSDELFWLIDKSGKQQGKAYSSLDDFESGYYVFTDDDGAGVIDYSGRVVVSHIPGSIAAIDKDARRMLVRKQDGSWGIVDPSGCVHAGQKSF